MRLPHAPSLLLLALAGCPDKSAPGPDTDGAGTSAAETTSSAPTGAGTSLETSTGTTAAPTSSGASSSTGDAETGESTGDPGCGVPCRFLPTCEDSVDLPITVQGQSASGPFVGVRAYVGLRLCCGCMLGQETGIRKFVLLNEDSGPPLESCDAPAPAPGGVPDFLDIEILGLQPQANAHCGDEPWVGATFEVDLKRRTTGDFEELPGHTLTFDAKSGAWDELDPTDMPRFEATLAGPNFTGSFVASMCDCFAGEACACE